MLRRARARFNCFSLFLSFFDVAQGPVPKIAFKAKEYCSGAPKSDGLEAAKFYNKASLELPRLMRGWTCRERWNQPNGTGNGGCVLFYCKWSSGLSTKPITRLFRNTDLCNVVSYRHNVTSVVRLQVSCRRFCCDAMSSAGSSASFARHK